MKERESEIQRAICEYLELRNHFFWRQNTAPAVQKSAAGWAFRCMSKFATRGVPDIIVVRVGRPYFLEVKRAGIYRSSEQREFQRQAAKTGAPYAVVRSIDDVQALGL